MKLAKRVFAIAGVYGLIVLLPLFAGPTEFARRNPPPVTHPVFFFGFAGVAIAWQVAFLIIARDPVRYRPLMIPGILEKLIFGIATVALYLSGDTNQAFFLGAIVDLILGAFFLLAWFRTAPDRV